MIISSVYIEYSMEEICFCMIHLYHNIYIVYKINIMHVKGAFLLINLIIINSN